MAMPLEATHSRRSLSLTRASAERYPRMFWFVSVFADERMHLIAQAIQAVIGKVASRYI